MQLNFDLCKFKEHHFSLPIKVINSFKDLQAFQADPVHQDYVKFLTDLQQSVLSKPISTTPEKHNSNLIKDFLLKLSQLVDQTPAFNEPMRYGNTAFRLWHQKMLAQAQQFLKGLLPQEIKQARIQLVAYLGQSFGSNSRLDFGTGHQLGFMFFLWSLHLLGFFPKDDFQQLVHHVFYQYIFLTRKILKIYKLEPAGSHGVWGLDDNYFLPFLLGAAEMIKHPEMHLPDSIFNDKLVKKHAPQYMYINCVQYVLSVKSGASLHEMSPTLANIGGAATWQKVKGGMIKMYVAEVLGKHPVIKHALFGSLIRLKMKAKWTQSYETTVRVVRDIMRGVNRGIQQKQLQKKIIDNQITKAIINDQINYDQESDHPLLFPEPPLPQKDSSVRWNNNCIKSRSPNNQFSSKAATKGQRRRRVVESQNVKWSPASVQIKQLEVVDAYQNQLRSRKEEQLQRRKQLQDHEHKKNFKKFQNQDRFKNLRNKKQIHYTYDFDGTPLPVQKIDFNKLPVIAVQVNANSLPPPIKKQQASKSFSKYSAKTLANYLKKQQIQPEPFLQTFNYNQCTVSQGITLFFNGLKKVGPKHKTDVSMLTNLNSLENQCIQMKDYLQIVKRGRIKKQNTDNFTKYTIQPNSDFAATLDKNEKEIPKPQPILSQGKISLLKNVDFGIQGPPPYLPNMRQIPKRSSQEQLISEKDRFNIQLANSQDWGKKGFRTGQFHVPNFKRMRAKIKR